MTYDVYDVYITEVVVMLELCLDVGWAAPGDDSAPTRKSCGVGEVEI